ncbi:AAA family ATPase [Pseudomonas resinovorans]|uniref:AAA family ATPase n=1 Tax=Metapseudomonas resinovorans TaxID=53412 RepID=UPI00237FCC2D|nr:AAA family ATPase [Pseudomonas resinovorans]MDE3738604.1 AAA family ATPase [Pseudomonas resinovorans]
MYLSKIEVKNIKSLDSFVWSLGPKEQKQGWHVLLGDNGSGKSALLKACAIALMGPKNALGARIVGSEWVRQGQTEGRVTIHLTQDYIKDQWSGKGNTTVGTLRASVKITESGVDSIDITPSPNRHIWGAGSGWFSASYGPYRRFSGGNKEHEKLFYSMPKLSRHLSIFGEDVALSETLSWLQDLHYTLLDEEKKGHRSPAGRFLKNLKNFINQDNFLPNDVKLEEINPRNILFKDSNGAEISITNLSDGYRSILSMTLELIRQLAMNYGPESIFRDSDKEINLPGVVIVDEIDVHLHPRWQRVIGPWFTKHFPNIQFIVTTHSPLVCQGALNGSVTVLPSPGTSERGGRLLGSALDRLLYGDILEALSSGAFGKGIERSDAAQAMLFELAKLNLSSRRRSLKSDEKIRQEELKTIFATSFSTEEAN